MSPVVTAISSLIFTGQTSTLGKCGSGQRISPEPSIATMWQEIKYW